MAKRVGLSARGSAVQAALIAGAGDGKAEAEPAPEKPAEADKVAMTVRLDGERHEALRRLAFDRRVSIHRLLVEGVDLVLGRRPTE